VPPKHTIVDARIVDRERPQPHALHDVQETERLSGPRAAFRM
jgi:hypothetical protein